MNQETRPRRVAFLDLDHTLLAADSNQLWMAHLLARGWITPAAVTEHERFVADYAQGRLDFPALQAFRCHLDASLPTARLADERSAFEQTRLLPALAPQAPDLVRQLHAQGYWPVLVSATRPVLVTPVAQHLGIAPVIAPFFGADKVQAVHHWLAAQATSLTELEDSRFYSDSHNDLPLLEAVASPIVVDPDPTLAALARHRNWPVMSLRLPTTTLV